MPNEFDALLGIGMQPDPRQMSEALRRQAFAGDTMAGSSIEAVAQGGMNDAASARDAAKQAGILEDSRNKARLSRTMAARKGAAPKTMDSYRKKNNHDVTAMLYQDGAYLNNADTRRPVEGLPSEWEKEPEEGVDKGAEVSIPLINKKDATEIHATWDRGAKYWKNLATGERITRNDWREPREKVPEKVRETAVKDLGQYRMLRRLQDAYDPSMQGTKEGDIPFAKTIELWATRTMPTQASYLFGENALKVADWERQKGRWIDMITKHEMFGSALSKYEIKDWANKNVGAENTSEQVMLSLRNLVDEKIGKIKRTARSLKGTYNAKGIQRIFGDEIDIIDSEYSMPNPEVEGDPEAKALWDKLSRRQQKKYLATVGVQ